MKVKKYIHDFKMFESMMNDSEMEDRDHDMENHEEMMDDDNEHETGDLSVEPTDDEFDNEHLPNERPAVLHDPGYHSEDREVLAIVDDLKRGHHTGDEELMKSAIRKWFDLLDKDPMFITHLQRKVVSDLVRIMKEIPNAKELVHSVSGGKVNMGGRAFHVPNRVR